MATLVKSRTRVFVDREDEDLREDLDSDIPEPFPLSVVKLQGQMKVEDEIVDDNVESDEDRQLETMEDRELSLDVQDVNETVQIEMHPSILRVQQSCLSTLNNLLMPQDPLHPWRPIIPSRRYSMPLRVQDTTESSDYPLTTILENLRSIDTGVMIQIGSQDNTTSLYQELREHVQRLSSNLSARDAELAFSLVTLVSRLDRLSLLSPNLRDNFSQITPVDAYSPVDMYDALSRHVSSFQLSQMDVQDSSSTDEVHRPVEEVEAALLWHNIDADFENVLRLCHQNSDSRSAGDLESLPPGYEDRLGDLPGYEYNEDFKVFGKEISAPSIAETTNEKMKLELDSVVMAIERMYIVAPQLHNQRAELRHRNKIADSIDMEPGTSTSTSSRTRKDSAIVDLILKSANRRYMDQTYVLSEGGMTTQIEKNKQKDRIQREVFVEHLIERTSSGRLVGQDAHPPGDRERDPEEMISLPEFIREPVPKSLVLTRAKSSEESKTNQAGPSNSSSGLSSVNGTKLLHKNSARNLIAKADGSRQRSHSLSSLARLFPGHRSPSPRVVGKMKASEENLFDLGEEKVLNLQYVAEYQENLQTIVVLVHILGLAAPNAKTVPSLRECEAEIIPWADNNPKLVIHYNSHSSPPLTLPAPAIVGTYSVTTFPGNPSFDIKIPVSGREEIKGSRTPPTLLSAEELEDLDPSAFICTSCSLPIIKCRPTSTSSSSLTSSSTPSTRSAVESSTPPPKPFTRYLNLPSEYWSELVDAWMCHPSQELSDVIGKYSKEGIWPRPGSGQVFSGSSHVVVCEEDVVRDNLRLEREGEEWSFARCLCGSMIGKCKGISTVCEGKEELYNCYRFAKYSIRPSAPSSEHVRLSLPAFFVEDMHCVAQMHANWRFVIYDDEEDKPRFLIWLFKPCIMVSWSTPTYRSISGEGKQLCAKVLYKILDSSVTRETIEPTLNRYPNFSRAEPFYYPMSACRRLTTLLKDSNRLFPEGMRQMAGLDIGFLERAQP